MEWTLSFINEDSITIVTRLVVAALLGGIIGVEREYHKHPAGFRTHLLVCLGACLIMLLAMFGFQDYMRENEQYVNFDPSRLAAYVVSGIGFLGAGTILVQGYTVRGLTTAASIWVVAGIGLAVGVGMYFAGLFTTIIVILSLVFLNKFDQTFFSRARKIEAIVIHAKPQDATLLTIISVIEEKNIKVKKVMVERDKTTLDTEELLRYQLKLVYPNKQTKVEVIDALYKIDQVQKVYSLST